MLTILPCPALIANPMIGKDGECLRVAMIGGQAPIALSYKKKFCNYKPLWH